MKKLMKLALFSGLIVGGLNSYATVNAVATQAGEYTENIKTITKDLDIIQEKVAILVPKIKQIIAARNDNWLLIKAIALNGPAIATEGFAAASAAADAVNEAVKLGNANPDVKRLAYQSIDPLVESATFKNLTKELSELVKLSPDVIKPILEKLVNNLDKLPLLIKSLMR